jgi:hypothetical protein
MLWGTHNLSSTSVQQFLLQLFLTLHQYIQQNQNYNNRNLLTKY